MSGKCQNMWLNLYGNDLETCYDYVKRGHRWSALPRRCKNLLSSYFSLSRDGYENSRLTQLSLRDYDDGSGSGSTEYYCDTFCKDTPCVNQCKKWGCGNCEGVDAVRASDITEAVNAAKDAWGDKGASWRLSDRELWYVSENARSGRDADHYASNLKHMDDNGSAYNTYTDAIPMSELRAWS